MSGSSLQELIDRAVSAATDTRVVRIGHAQLGAVDDLFQQQFDNRPAVIVADERTYGIAGALVERHLKDAGRDVQPAIIFPAAPTLKPARRQAESIAGMIAATSAIPIAVGSGTINDLTKYGSHLAARPYMVVGTAASMDGYTASGAALVDNGFKQTFPCPAPRAVLADLDIILTAPPDMTASGYADLLGKITAGADWLVADMLDVEPLKPDIWRMVQDPLRALLADPAGIRHHDPNSVERLLNGLVITGLAMQAAAGSRPASGSEHQFSHLWEMAGLSHNGAVVSHGFKVGVGSVAVAALYEQLIARDLAALDIDAACRAWPSFGSLEQTIRQNLRGADKISRAIVESRAKYLSVEDLRRRLTLLRRVWPDLRQRLADQLSPAAEIARMLQAAGSPSTPTDIGLTFDELRASYAAARLIRRRYTVLDLAAETGLFEPCVTRLFQPDGYWFERENVGATHQEAAASS